MTLSHAPLLPRAFFDRNTVIVARELLGKTLSFTDADGVTHSGRITETEAYVGQDDPACHAARGLTKRNAVMFGAPGFSYVYFIYGMYYCLNIVTEAKGFAAAVLIRGVLDDNGTHWNGPGKLCRAWNITTADNGLDMTEGQPFALYETPSFADFTATPRIGIRHGLDRDWRFLATLPKTEKKRPAKVKTGGI